MLMADVYHRAMFSALLFRWYALDKGDLAFIAMLALFVAVLGGITGFAYVDHAQRAAAEHRRVDLACLAENVYYEARGEPLAGQYAVAEVTMNRVASGSFPDTVCDVVHESRFDPVRKRRVGAFSWTELDALPRPKGYEWRRATAVASSVYDNQEAPLVDGALYYHAIRVTPAWARTKAQVARIGRHVFYE
jgi:spore germination cell wall hydrolase CwlJ-like protein